MEGGRKNGKRYNKVVGDVLFIQGMTEIYCDSAFFYRRANAIEAFGRIRIYDHADSSEITADRLKYAGDDQFAELRNNVVYKKDSLILYTDNLDYNLYDKSARYFSGGKILDGSNVLTSLNMFYDSQNQQMEFRRNVILVNPDNTLKADKLDYDMATKIAKTFGPTEVISNDGRTVFSEEGGTFDMKVSRTSLKSGTIETSSYILEGDDLYYDEKLGLNRAVGNIYMLSKDEDIIITGEESINYQNTGITKIFGDPLMKKATGTDTLYLRADTMIIYDNQDIKERHLDAFQNVRIYKADFQAIADSLIYDFGDSIIYFFNDPVLWTAKNQIEADIINIKINKSEIETMDLNTNSFMILQDSLGNFNQLKGKTMKAHFIDNMINHLDVNGNSECIFFALDEIENTIMGMNKIICSEMTIRFIDNRADNISFYTSPEAQFIPPHELQESDKELKGFAWRADERPYLMMLLTGTMPEKPELEFLERDGEAGSMDKNKPFFKKLSLEEDKMSNH